MPSRSDPPVFSLQDANAAIPDLTRALPELRRVRREIGRLDDRIRILELICHPSVVEGNPDHRELRTLRRKSERKVGRLETAMAEMEGRGHHLIDLDRGVVHFEARRDAVPILLCWREGEEEIRHWHCLEEGAPDERRRRDLGDSGN
jgi:hypothetical protein